MKYFILKNKKTLYINYFDKKHHIFFSNIVVDNYLFIYLIVAVSCQSFIIRFSTV